MRLTTGLFAASIVLTASLWGPSPTANAQHATAYYYPAPGDYATTRGTVRIPAAGYYYNVPAHIAASPSSGRIITPRTVVLGGLSITLNPGLPPAARSNVPTYNPTDPW